MYEDKRPIEEMVFGVGALDQEATARTVRDILRRCNVEVADDINQLGCTGAYASLHRTLSKQQAIDTIRFLRLGLGGGGVGLPCFVPVTRFCLAHDTIGGLEQGQQAYHTDFVYPISRELTQLEESRVALLDQARRGRGKDREMDALELLNGQNVEGAVAAVEARQKRKELLTETLEEAPMNGSVSSKAPPVPTVEHEAAPREQRAVTLDEEAALVNAIARQQPWTCSTHTEPDWSCRFCVAQEIAKGMDELTYATLAWLPGDDIGTAAIDSVHVAVAPAAVAPTIASYEEEGAALVHLHVRLAAFFAQTQTRLVRK